MLSKSRYPFSQIIFASALAFFATKAIAAPVNAATMLDNISKTIPNLMQLVTALAYVMGMVMIIRGIMSLKDYGESRMQRSESHGIKGPLVLLTVGTLMLYIPSTVHSGLTTFWSDPNPYAYETESTDQWSELINSIFLIVQFIGTIAFIRGLLILSHAGEAQQQQGSFGRAMSHLVGGIFCINLYGFLQAIFSTLGLPSI